MDLQDLYRRVERLEQERRRTRALALLGAVVLALAGPLALGASGVTGLTSFTNGSVASADAVNENFDALAGAVNDNDARLTTIEGHRVSFLAKFSPGGNLAPVQTRVPFDQEIFDDGNGFSPATGEFVVPESGRYVFSWRIVFGNATASNNYRRVGIKVDGADYAGIPTTLGVFVNVGDNSYLHFSDTIVMSLAAGQKVSIATDGYPNFNGTLYRPPCYFSGWRLY